MSSLGICERCGGKGEIWTGQKRIPCWWCDGSGRNKPGPRKTGTAIRQ